MNGTWHDDLENASTIDEAVASVKRYLGTLPAGELADLDRYCRPSRITGDGDVDDLTFKLEQARRQPSGATRNDALLGDVFNFVLHASLRISHLNRVRASGMGFFGGRGQMSQMG